MNDYNHGSALNQMATAQTTQPSSEIDHLNMRIEELTGRASHLVDQLANVADRLFGARPPSENGTAPTPCRSGRLGDAQDNIDRLSVALDAAASQANRLTAL